MREEIVEGVILAADYSKEFDTVSFDIERIDGSTITRTWPRKDFGHCMKICKKGVLIPVKMLVNWLPTLIDKNITVMFDSPEVIAPYVTPEQQDEINEQMQNISNVLANRAGTSKTQAPKYRPRTYGPFIGHEEE